MLLFDRVLAERTPVVIDLDGRGRYSLPGSGTCARALRACERRHLLTPERFISCIDNVERWSRAWEFNPATRRFHARTFWVEWTAIECDQQLGILVVANADRRAAELKLFFSREDGGADLSPFSILVDFDRTICEQQDGATRFALAADGMPLDLSRHALISVDLGWADYFRATELGSTAVQQLVVAQADCLSGDLILALAFNHFVNALGQFDVYSDPLWRSMPPPLVSIIAPIIGAKAAPIPGIDRLRVDAQRRRPITQQDVQPNFVR